jgi:hypothetical protein
MEKQRFKIRFNTKSIDDKKCWRIIDSNDQETLVDDIIIQTSCCTTKDWIEDIQEFKFHLTCVGILTIENDFARIS